MAKCAGLLLIFLGALVSATTAVALDDHAKELLNDIVHGQDTAGAAVPPSSAHPGESSLPCSYWKQKADELRALASRERAQASKAGSDPGGYHAQAAQVASQGASANEGRYQECVRRGGAQRSGGRAHGSGSRGPVGGQGGGRASDTARELSDGLQQNSRDAHRRSMGDLEDVERQLESDQYCGTGRGGSLAKSLPRTSLEDFEDEEPEPTDNAHEQQAHGSSERGARYITGEYEEPTRHRKPEISLAPVEKRDIYFGGDPNKAGGRPLVPDDGAESPVGKGSKVDDGNVAQGVPDSHEMSPRTDGTTAGPLVGSLDSDRGDDLVREGRYANGEPGPLDAPPPPPAPSLFNEMLSSIVDSPMDTAENMAFATGQHIKDRLTAGPEWREAIGRSGNESFVARNPGDRPLRYRRSDYIPAYNADGSLFVGPPPDGSYYKVYEGYKGAPIRSTALSHRLLDDLQLAMDRGEPIADYAVDPNSGALINDVEMKGIRDPMRTRGWTDHLDRRNPNGLCREWRAPGYTPPTWWNKMKETAFPNREEYLVDGLVQAGVDGLSDRIVEKALTETRNAIERQRGRPLSEVEDLELRQRVQFATVPQLLGHGDWTGRSMEFVGDVFKHMAQPLDDSDGGFMSVGEE